LTVRSSATLDGGFGILKAQGANFPDELGRNVEVNQLSDLCLVTALNYDRLNKNLHHVSIKMLVDVENTLCGNEGTVRISGSQKEVYSFELQIFEDLIQHWGNLLKTALNQPFFELKVVDPVVAYQLQ